MECILKSQISESTDEKNTISSVLNWIVSCPQMDLIHLWLQSDWSKEINSMNVIYSGFKKFRINLDKLIFYSKSIINSISRIEIRFEIRFEISSI